MMRFIKLISVLLLLTMLLPLAVACAGNPPPPSNEDTPSNNDEPSGNETQGGEQGGNQGDEQGCGQEPQIIDYVTAKISSYDENLLVDFTSDAMAQINTNFKQNQITDSALGKTVYSWNSASPLNFAFTGEVNVGKYHFIEFKIFIPETFNSTVSIQLSGIGTTSFKPKFSGWHTYRFRTDSFSVKNPYPNATGIGFSTGVSADIKITDIKAITPIYELTPPEGVSLGDKSIYTHITDRFVLTQVGTAEQAVNPTAERQSHVDIIDDRCRRTLLKFPESFSPDTFCDLFGIEINLTGTPSYGEQDDSVGLGVRSFYNQINIMAIAYACYGGTYFKDPTVLNRIKQCLEYGYKFTYGEPILQNGKTWGDWYNWDIATPDHLLATLCLIRNELTQNEINKYLSPYLKLVSRPYGTASNLLSFCRHQLIAGALTNDPMRIMIATEQAQDAYTNIDEIDTNAPIIPTNDGFYSDGSFVQHNTIAYTGSYGMGLLSGTISLFSLTAGGVFEPHSEKVANHYEWIFDSFLTLVYGKSFMSTVNGRDTYIDTDSSKTRLIVGHALSMIEYAPDDTKARLMSEIRALQLLFNDNFAANASLHMIDFAIALKNDTSVTPATPQAYGKVFGAMGRVVQHGPNYGVAIALSSTRIAKYESINTQNEAAWYQGDGMIYIYTDDYDYNKYFYYFANPYLMPGTTVNTATRKYECLSPALLGTNSFAGGVEQGIYSSAGFILSYNPNSAWASKTFYSIDDTKIMAKKSYFMFDDEIVCIGSDIRDESGYDVLTVVENRLWRDGDVLSINGVSIEPETGKTNINARTMHFTNMGGYVFLRYNNEDSDTDKDGNVLSYAKVTNSFINEGWSQYISDAEYNNMLNTKKDFLEITLNHGIINNTPGKYAYVYLPEATAQETESYADVEILIRDLNTHAVIEKTLGIVACNFFDDTGGEVNTTNAGDFSAYTALTKVTAKDACSIMITKNTDGSYTVSVSDPTNSLTSMTLEIDIRDLSTVISADSGIVSLINGNTLTLKIDCAGNVGNTYNVTVK